MDPMKRKPLTVPKAYLNGIIADMYARATSFTDCSKGRIFWIGGKSYLVNWENLNV